jgi:hypothetical protein
VVDGTEVTVGSAVVEGAEDVVVDGVEVMAGGTLVGAWVVEADGGDVS